ncbi:hypothetical protein [Micromonospora carbonacea]|uniref:Uncharacterized protein n=1 Tax=Micromonospora carbonacea TaxID=47853 RepID=A0A1C5ADB5_9ACTN|nr:hypothetical protein [Micromonospora carbonacea]SCF43159.1 hypothetical protein GA0070563_112196 [Micromonospora carbonacea]
MDARAAKREAHQIAADQIRQFLRSVDSPHAPEQADHDRIEAALLELAEAHDRRAAR